MNSNGRFSEVSLAYNANIGNLDEARNIFQKELSDLDQTVKDHAEEALRRKVDEDQITKWRWGRPEDWSTIKDGPWQNYISGTIIPLDVMIPGYKRFKKEVAYLYFESRMDRKFGRFMFRARFENNNKANKNLDEKIFEILEREKSSDYPHYEQVKSNTAIIWRHEITSELYDSLHEIMDLAMRVCEQSVEEIFPDSEYLLHEDSAVDSDEMEDFNEA